MSDFKTPTLRGAHARSLEALRRRQDQPSPLLERSIAGCRIVGVKGPPDGSHQPERPGEDRHYWAVLELPEDFGRRQFSVRFGHTNHELLSSYGNAGALIGKRCRLVYRGHGLESIRQGRAYIEPDWEAQELDSRDVLNQFDICQGMMGSFSRGKRDPGFGEDVRATPDRDRKGSKY